MLRLKSTSSLFRVVNGRGSVRPAVPDSHLGLFKVDAFTCYLLVISHKSFIYLTSPCSFARKSTRLMIIVSTGLSCLSYSEPDKRNMMFSDNEGFISFLASVRVYSNDFGGRLGKPEFVRRSAPGPSDGRVSCHKTLRGTLKLPIGVKDGDCVRSSKRMYHIYWGSYNSHVKRSRKV